MERSFRSSRALPLLMGLIVAGCSPESPPPTQEPGTQFFTDSTAKTTSLTGFSWDPEAFWFSAGSCGETCPIPPMLAPGIPHFERALIGGASVAVFDPEQGAPAGAATGPTAADGSWFVPAVPSRGEVPYFTFAVDGAVPTEGPDGFGGGFLPPIPATPGYLPTLALQPIFTARSTACFFQQSPQIGSTGIIDAVAKYLTSTGTTTAVEDLLDPSKFGGVVVWWSYSPGPPVMRLPAFGTGLTVGGADLPAPAGTKVLSVVWAPPGEGPPDLQSPRGFFVAEEGSPTEEGGVSLPSSGIGLSVVLFPPAEGLTFGLFKVADPVEDPAQGRPWQFGPIGTPVPPGIVSFVGTQIFPQADPTQPGPPPDADVTPAWLCLPPE